MNELTPDRKSRIASATQNKKSSEINSCPDNSNPSISGRKERLARAAEYLEVARLTPAELAALHDPNIAKEQLRQIFEAADGDTSNKNSSSNIQESILNDEVYQADNSFFEIDIDDNEGSSRALIKSAELNLIEVSGIIKWFDAAKGYGFIVPDKNLPDILLHVTTLRAGGYQIAFEGARIFAQCMRGARGLQVFRILSMDNSSGIHPSQLTERSADVVKAESAWEKAVVKWFNRIRGVGILSSIPIGREVFVHINTIRRYGFSELRPGQRLEIRWGSGRKGLIVAEMRPGQSVSNLPSTH